MPEALESSSDSFSPLIGVNPGTYQCLENEREEINASHVKYSPDGPNSNTWAIQVCQACQLVYPELPDGILVGAGSSF